MAFLLRGTWQPGVDGMGCFRIPDFAPISAVLSPSASRFRCFGAPINPLLSGETPKLKKNIRVDMYEGGSPGQGNGRTRGGRGAR